MSLNELLSSKPIRRSWWVTSMRNLDAKEKPERRHWQAEWQEWYNGSSEKKKKDYMWAIPGRWRQTLKKTTVLSVKKLFSVQKKPSVPSLGRWVESLRGNKEAGEKLEKSYEKYYIRNIEPLFFEELIRKKLKEDLEKYKRKRLVAATKWKQSLGKCRWKFLFYRPKIKTLREGGRRVADWTEIKKKKRFYSSNSHLQAARSPSAD